MRQIASKSPHGRRFVIPKALTGGMDLIILTRDVYEREVRQGREIANALQLIAEGERAHREGRTLKASSLQKALALHAKRSH